MSHPPPATPPAAPHRLRPARGRDPGESHRTATPLELLFDLTFVVAFGQAGSELAHYLAEGHVGAGLLGFGLAVFAICWAWINYSWWASAYDTDDWVTRVLVMVQMVGVLVLALGLPELFASIDDPAAHDHTLDNRVMVAGYVVMRVAMVTLWLRAARQDPERRRTCLSYAVWVGAAQVGWVALGLLALSLRVSLVCGTVLILLEMTGPYVAEHKRATPWHAHHIAERYGLLVIITLGEGVIGTVASLSAVVHGPEGWSVDAAVVAVAGTLLTFGLWWTYFLTPAAEVLAAHRERAFGWGYGHLVVFAGLAGTGAGLHAAAYYLEHHSELGATATVLAVAVPVAVFIAADYAVWTALVRRSSPLHLVLLTGTAVVLVTAVLLAAGGLDMAWSLLVLSLAPLVTVLGFETGGHRKVAAEVELATRSG